MKNKPTYLQVRTNTLRILWPSFEVCFPLSRFICQFLLQSQVKEWRSAYKTADDFMSTASCIAVALRSVSPIVALYPVPHYNNSYSHPKDLRE